ncbi:MAG: ribonuclease Z [Methanosarcinales archaeon]|nr:ribonuclease Z [Methanosarcinales archaeon]
MLRVTFLGTGGSLPTPHRNPSAILVNREGELMLFDCGEGTQQQMMRAKTGMMKLSSIFITHLHADHILGIPGLVQTMSFQGRTDPLFIYAPERSGDQIEQLTRIGHTRPKFEVQITELFPGDVVEVDEYDILAIRTEHNMPSIGYALSEHQRTGRFNRERAIELGVPPGPLFSRLQHGESVVVDGTTVHPGDVLGSPRPGRKIVYTGDTRPTEEVLEASRDADLLIHDSSLAHDLIGWARETMHSTAREAALLAKEAGVRELVLTHISSRYADASPILKDAEEVFDHVQVARDFLEIEIPYRDS